ncbi:MAG: bifunctional diguanylate cyclase/phosphodiesterase [Treponema sp.]|nr:bifunctional diguanylate cyclase/phosphodiesterase [Candidatus Treponema equifaecale]
MSRKGIKRFIRSTSLSGGQKRALAAIVIIGFVIQISVISIYYKIQTEQEITAAQVYGETVAAGIELSLNQSVNTTEVMKDLYLEYGDYFINDFNSICQRFVENNVAIGSMFIAPGGIIRCAYPKEMEESTLNFNMLIDPEQSERALLALHSKKITVAGPHRLVEGGTGFIIRNPIFVNGEFKAFSIVVLDWDKFVKQVLYHVSRKNSGYKFAVWKENDIHAVSDKNGFIFRNSDSKVSRLVSIKIEVPNDVWHLSVEPEDGWRGAFGIKIEILLSFVMLIGVIFFTYFRQREHARKIYYANHDDLTGLLVRTAFLKRVDALFRENPNAHYNVVAADIKDFKLINSMYGTEKSDELLVYLADYYLKLNPWGLCSRYGGDQFISIFPDENGKGVDTGIIENNSFEVIRNAPVPNVNIKYGVYEDVDVNLPANKVCDRALLAARSILSNYDAIVSNYEGPVSKSNMKKQELESSFLSALENENFKVWFQPKFDAVTEKLVGAEALVRWIKDDGKIVSPLDFISVFEEDGLIYKLDLYVFRQVCEKIKFWQDKGKNLVPISVNVSRVSLQHKNIIWDYKRIIEQTDINQELVPLEITESASSDVKETQRLAEEFKKAGFMIHMDDFGSGFSSLGNLNSMPFDEIKLDKSLVDYIGTPGGEELLKHTLALVQFKGLKTIAEGVETKEQLEFLRELKCDHIQGYYFSAPMPYEKFIDFIREHQ